MFKRPFFVRWIIFLVCGLIAGAEVYREGSNFSLPINLIGGVLVFTVIHLITHNIPSRRYCQRQDK